MKIDEISGFANFAVEDLSVAGEYVEGNSFDNTVIKFKLGMKTCPLDLHVKASAEFVTWIYSRWWQLKYFLFSPQKLGKMSNLTSIFFRWVETTNQYLINVNPGLINPYSDY